MAKCMYCCSELGGDSVIDICKKCMYQVWGDKMSRAIVDSVRKEKENGNLELWHNGREVKKEEKLGVGEGVDILEGEELSQEQLLEKEDEKMAESFVESSTDFGLNFVF